LFCRFLEAGTSVDRGCAIDIFVDAIRAGADNIVPATDCIVLKGIVLKDVPGARLYLKPEWHPSLDLLLPQARADLRGTRNPGMFSGKSS
jgi:hypothetical protein